MTLRVGILTYDFFPFVGGQGRVTYDLWWRLRERNDIDVVVCSPADNDLPGHTRMAGFSQRFGKHAAFSLAATARARAWCAAERIDVLHVNGGPGGALLLRDPGVPVVYSLYHTYEQVARLMPGHGWKSPAVRLERRAYGIAREVVASTESSAASLRERIGVRAPVTVVPCGVDFDAFPRLGLDRDASTILCVGRLDNRKNPLAAVDAFAYVARRNAHARLVIVGTGPLEQKLHARVAELGLRERVSFERFVSHETLVEWYNRAAIVVVPSLFEGFGLAAVEAQSCGASVVGTDSEGLRDVIVDGETGLLAGIEPERLAGEIIELLDDEPRRVGLGNAAAAHVRTVFAWDDVVERLVGVYKRAAGGSATTEAQQDSTRLGASWGKKAS